MGSDPMPVTFFLCAYAGSTEQRRETASRTGVSKTPITTMLPEQVPVVWEVDVFMGTTAPPNGYVNFRYSDGRDYSGYMVQGVPQGFGVMRGKVLSYVGIFDDGFLSEGIMVDAVRAVKFDIPWATPPPESGRSPDPQ